MTDTTDANGDGKTGEPDATPVVRTVVLAAPDMVREFAKLLRAANPLAMIIHRELQRTHGLAQGTPIQIAGVLVNIAETPTGRPPGQSRIVRPSGPLPPPPAPRPRRK